MGIVINKLRPARQDLVDAFYHYVRQGSLPTARRFLRQAEATLKRIASMPGMGTRYEPDEPLYADVRYFPISRFRSYLIFYRPVAGGIEVLRVLHGARDIHGILSEEFGIDEHAGDGKADQDEP
jgi:toxin ParE1/3/4